MNAAVHAQSTRTHTAPNKPESDKMKYASVLFAGLLATAYPAMAAEEQPKACLTQDQINKLVTSESAKAIAQFVAQEKSAAAKDAYEIVQKAFTPAPADAPNAAPAAPAAPNAPDLHHRP